MQHKILYVINNHQYYLVVINLDKYVEVSHLLEYLKYEPIYNQDSLTEALNKYCKTFATATYKPNWFYEDLDEVVKVI